MIATEDSYEDLYELAPCGYLSTTTSGTIIKVNKTLLDWTGFSREDILGTSLLELFDPATRLFYETRYTPVLHLETQVNEVALTIVRSDGTSMPILMNSRLSKGPDSDDVLVRSAIFDATSRQNYERDLLEARRAAESSEQRNRILQGASAAYAVARSEEALAEALAESARTAFDATAAAVFFLEHDDSLRLAGGHNPVNVVLPPHAIRPGAEALRTSMSVEITGMSDSDVRFPEVLQALHAARVAAVSATPILGDEGPIGLLVCYFGREREFSQQVLDLQASLVDQASQVITRIRLERQLERMALHDSLTGLANRSLLQEQLGKALAGAKRIGEPLAVIFLDLDGFKSVNDTAGHAAGDEVLREVASRLRTSVRHEDIVGRLGGDEFVAICSGADRDAAFEVANRIAAAIRRPIEAAPAGISITASVGVALHDGTRATAAGVDAMITLADAAMYRSKNDGGDRTTVLVAS